MPASSSLSVELWQAILRYSIGVADFFDPDAFEAVVAQHLISDTNSAKNNETEYWASEKARNRLQSVSKSWDSYLRPFEHRFVRMLDIWHGNVDPERLKRAIRVSFSRYNCRCKPFCFPGISPSTGPLPFRAFCWNTLGQTGNMDMVIADLMQEEHRVAEFTFCLQQFRNVKTFIGTGCTYSGHFSLLLEQLPNIRHFYGKGYWGTREHSKPSRLMSNNVVTLSLHSRKGENYRSVEWNLPSLRYLRLKDDSEQPLSEFVISAVIPLLQGVGSQLRALYLYHRTEEPRRDVPKELWDWSPHLEILRTGMSLTFPPPFFHPIHTVVLADEKQSKEIAELPEWPNLRKVKFDFPWSWALEGTKRYYFDSRASVRVEDRDGYTAKEYENLDK